jgi:hypothetical protein
MSKITQSFTKLYLFIIANIFIGATKWSCLPSEFVELLLGSVSHIDIIGGVNYLTPVYKICHFRVLKNNCL